jgi:quercetin dioxygenase-like cupin family protein
MGGKRTLALAISGLNFAGAFMRSILSMLTLIAVSTFAAAETIPVRTPIGSFPIVPSKPVTHVELTRVDFLPGQEMPEHMHPVPVVCFVTKGGFVVSIGAEPARRVQVGETTIEPAGAVVHYFRNATNEPAQLDCAALAGPDDKTLSVMLSNPNK